MAAHSEQYGFNSKYLCHNIWDEGSAALSFSTKKWMETAAPLAFVPGSELNNPIVSQMVHKNTDLFGITTPINVDMFKLMLAEHYDLDG